MIPSHADHTPEQIREMAVRHVCYGWARAPWGDWSKEQLRIYDEEFFRFLEECKNLKPSYKPPCPKCGKNPRQDCGYGHWTSTTDGKDFDCLAPDNKGQPCDDCHHVWCEECKKVALQTIAQQGS